MLFVLLFLHSTQRNSISEFSLRFHRFSKLRSKCRITMCCFLRREELYGVEDFEEKKKKMESRSEE